MIMKSIHYLPNRALCLLFPFLKFSLLTFLVLAFIVSSCKKDDDDEEEVQETSLINEEFDEPSLNLAWSWQYEPDIWDIGTSRDGWLTIVGKLNSNIYCDDRTTRLYQEINYDQNFDIRTKMYCKWGNNESDIAGLIIKSLHSGEWILIKLWMWEDGSGRLEFQHQCEDIISPVPASLVAGGETEVFLRFVKIGSDYSGYFKFDESNDWIFIGTSQFSDQLPLQVGLFGGVDSGTGELLIQYDYFRAE